MPVIVWKSSLACGGTSSTAPRITSPRPPSTEISSPSEIVIPSTVKLRATGSICSDSTPQTHGLPIPRATTAACDVMPPCAVTTAWAWITP